MFHRTFECPSCGSQIGQKHPGSRTLVCSYCGQTSHLNADSLQSAGELTRGLNLDAITVGNRVDLGLGKDKTVFITSKSRATVNGGEGELPFKIIPGEPAVFVEGIIKGMLISSEILPDEQVLYVGQPFKIEEFARA